MLITLNMFPFRVGFVLFLVLFVIAAPVLSNELPSVIQQKLKRAGIPESAVGIYISEVGANKPVLAVNADTAMNPASVMKLITTFAGLEILGPAYTWQTILYANGKIEAGILQGDLVIKGYGDPKLDLENFWLLIHHLRQTGLREITGDLILDQSHYDLPKGDPGAFDGQPFRTYNILPEALLINYRTSALHFIPHPKNNNVRAVADPLPESLQLINNLKLTRRECGDWRSLLDLDIKAGEGGENSMSVVLNGSYSIHCGKRTHLLGLHDSSSYTRDLFKRLWTQQGGVFQGGVRIGEAPKGIAPLEVYHSPPLAVIVRGINKFSNNIAARQLYLTLGTATASTRNNSPATLEKSNWAMRQWLLSRQMDFPEFVVDNGSGLSRRGRISANHMGSILQAAFQSLVMPEFISSLPIAAIDGTMRNRLKGTPVSGLAHMKTGTLNAVKALAGYMLNKSGQRFVVVFFVNHPKANRARGAMDSLLQWVHKR